MKYQKLFHLLKKRGITPTSLIDIGLIHPSTMIRLKNDKCVSLHTLELIARYLGCSLSDIISFD